MKCISNFSAAYEWNIPMIDNVLGNEYKKYDRNGSIIEYTVTNKNMSYRKKGCIIHVRGKALPPGAVVKRNGILISSPELVFLELANKLNIQQLILLGIQMCSHPVGEKEKAVTTKRKLEIFINKMSGHNGYLNAKRALKYIEDGSASIMESLVLMFLILPHKLGGYGLNGANLNHEIMLRKNIRNYLDKKQCYIDIYFPIQKIGVEYDSFTYHNSPMAQESDMMRSSALKHQGIEIIHLGTKQLYDPREFKKFEKNVATRLGKQLQIRTDKFETEHKKLRVMLPRRSNY